MSERSISVRLNTDFPDPVDTPFMADAVPEGRKPFVFCKVEEHSGNTHGNRREALKFEDCYIYSFSHADPGDGI